MTGVTGRKLELRTIHEVLLTRQAVTMWSGQLERLIVKHDVLSKHMEDMIDKHIKLAERVASIAIHLLSVDKRVVSLERKPSHLGSPRLTTSEYNPDHTPMGGIRIDPEQWEGIQHRFDEIEQEKDIKDAEVRGATTALANQKKRFLFWLKVAGGVFPILVVLFSLIAHVLHVWDTFDPPKLPTQQIGK
jgi:hypothetical protein